MERTSPVSATLRWSSPCPVPLWHVGGNRPFRRRPTATRRGSNGGEVRWSALAALPAFGSRVLSASAVVAYVAVGAAAPNSVPDSGLDRWVPRPESILGRW